jgi:hypothetical protein
MSWMARSPRAAKLGAVALVLLALAAAYALGVFDRLGDPRALARSLVAMGAWGYLAFIVAYTVLQPFGVPGTIFVVAAPLLWPWPAAFAVSMMGTMGASVVGFGFARFVARDWARARIPARLRRYDDALARHAFQTVFVLRLVLWMPPVLHAFFGVSRVGGPPPGWATRRRSAPPRGRGSDDGGGVVDASGRIQPRAWPIMGGLLVASLLVAVVVRALERRRRADS